MPSLLIFLLLLFATDVLCSTTHRALQRLLWQKEKDTLLVLVLAHALSSRLENNGRHERAHLFGGHGGLCVRPRGWTAAVSIRRSLLID